MFRVLLWKTVPSLLILGAKGKNKQLGVQVAAGLLKRHPPVELLVLRGSLSWASVFPSPIGRLSAEGYGRPAGGVPRALREAGRASWPACNL